MACTLTQSILLGCKEVTGGIKEIKVKALTAVPFTDVTINNGVGTIGANSQTGWYIYQFEKETGSLTETLTANPQNATVAYTQELKIKIHKLDATKQVEFNSLAKARLLVAVLTMNGEAWLLGYDMGADVTQITGNTGTALGDANGYEITIQSKQKYAMLDITADYANLVTT